jgi:hypothetical protein
MGDEIEGAMQHAPHWGRHSIIRENVVSALHSSFATGRSFLLRHAQDPMARSQARLLTRVRIGLFP